MSITLNNNTFKTWEDVETEFFSPEEIAQSKLNAALIKELVAARESSKLTQSDLESLTGIKRPVISRIENGHANPRIDTLLKLLAPLGKTLAIVPLQK